MPYEKSKIQRYQNLGGINSKVSQYLTGDMEWLSLENVDFQQPGSLTKRWGSTQYFGQSLTEKICGIYEFIQTSGFSSTLGTSSLIVIGGGTLGVAFNNGFSSVWHGSSAGSSYFMSYGSSFIDRFTLGSSLNADFETSQNNCFIANRKAFLKTTNGISYYFFGLPRPQFSGAGFNGIDNGGLGGSGNAGGFTGVYWYKFAWVNSYGMAGAPTKAFIGITGPLTFSTYVDYIITQGSTNIHFSVTAGGSGPDNVPSTRLVPPNYDITGLAVFRAGPFPSTGGGPGFTLPVLSPTRADVANSLGFTAYVCAVESEDFYLLEVLGVSAGSICATFIDTNVAGNGITLLNKNVLPWSWYSFWESHVGWPGNTHLWSLTLPIGYSIGLIPQMIETYANRLFFAGMTNQPSTAWFSEFNEPEHFEADWNFDVRLNDGEPVTAMKAYNGTLLFFKQTSFHVLTGDSPDTFVLTQVTGEYGCLGNRAVCEFEDQLVFLDRKGVILYNGANIDIISTKIDPIFARMNIPACYDNASIIYDKPRNQILIYIPVDGSTQANLTVVYDIVSKAWTTYTGLKVASTALATGGLSQQSVFFGGYSGLVSYYGQSFMADNGVGFTCLAQSPFISDMGNSITKLYRRLFTDSTPQGNSSAVTVNFRQDYGSSIVLSATFMQTPFQSRLDFGIPAKSLSIEYVMGSTHNMSLHGFVLEDRFLRPF